MRLLTVLKRYSCEIVKLWEPCAVNFVLANLLALKITIGNLKALCYVHICLSQVNTFS